MNKVLVSGNLRVTFSVMMTFFLFTSCAYKLSNKVDSLPKNIKSIFVPVFVNNSTESFVENAYTNSMRSEILRSGYAEVANSESSADAVLIGTIQAVTLAADESVIESKNTDFLPNKNVLSKLVKVTVRVNLVLKKKGSSEILWQGNFEQSRSYTPPQLTLPTINSANSLYNLSVRGQTLATLSKEMMQLAYDRLVDNF